MLSRMLGRPGSQGLRLCVVLSLLGGLAACGLADTAPPIGTAAVSLGRDRVPLGGPLEMTYRFTLAPDAPPLEDDYRVFVHFLDADGALMFSDDHDPPEPLSTWTAGREITYERRFFMPVYPYIGEATVAIGLYSPAQGDRLPLGGEHLGQRAYQVATFEMAPQSESGFLIFEDGWHEAESVPEDPEREWQWSMGRSTISFRNPRVDSTLYLEVDGRPELFDEPQLLILTIGETEIGRLEMAPEATFNELPVSAAAMGDDDSVTLVLTVEPPFVPSEITDGANPDGRELGVQVFYAFLETE